VQYDIFLKLVWMGLGIGETISLPSMTGYKSKPLRNGRGLVKLYLTGLYRVAQIALVHVAGIVYSGQGVLLY
jgi:hypothetical protein